ncbi:hypothetical protein bcere0016_35500 [Bacillus cereus 95/8201]|uniref:Uncharacterized protein n=2 Tax=Bacillus cereus TaxID=1396 RepID=B7JJ23_BACC0|nr:hypothetical protein BCAH820_3757 [Bacillus cereus AH820]ACO30204.1 hypothetical protein BCA_3840 [Bacillus cereus 03BB102]ACP13595.1 hypothetical protein BAMEG_0756 [Bacillus anthracis str. CDC 684]ACQ48093.1 hypothetical protein BAA_3900 [Bacillus anthracis str. A0248]AEW56836.1 Hypothetical protein bcf_18575 [Bacillus cereus F837/76]AFH85077.1 Hypothetical Protein H9401_3691 [Bacillus anthracis str. H9401]EDR17399.1 hypothetical protein BAC_3882 [Bacillus anthracis str. A0488]EDR87524.
MNKLCEIWFRETILNMTKFQTMDLYSIGEKDVEFCLTVSVYFSFYYI